MTKKLTYILIFALAAVVVAGITVGAIVLARQDNYDKDITLSEDGTVQEEMEFSLEGMYPGKSAEYSVHFGGVAGDFELSLSFRADGDTGLAQYVDAVLELNGEKVAEGRLSELLGGEAVSLSLSGDESVLVIRYTMPLEVGNEAQELVADFAVEIEATPAG